MIQRDYERLLRKAIRKSPRRGSFWQQDADQTFYLCFMNVPSWHASKAIREASGIKDHDERVKAFAHLAQEIGVVNENAIRDCDTFLGILDGADVDSGTPAIEDIEF
jgi:hypothetical protein